jgi:hypothetical protein
VVESFKWLFQLLRMDGFDVDSLNPNRLKYLDSATEESIDAKIRIVPGLCLTKNGPTLPAITTLRCHSMAL